MPTRRLVRDSLALYTTTLALTGLSLFAATAQAQPSNAQAQALDVPAGRYVLDRDHSNLAFSVQHMGLSNYVMRLTHYEVKLDLDTDDIAKSSVEVSMDPKSIAVDYYSDYNASHPDAEYDSWTETLASSDKFLNAGEHPQIRYRSRSVAQTGPGTMRIEGNLTLRGQTHPVTLNATVTGAIPSHPMAGKPAVAFSATGEFKRSQFGMDYLIQPPLVSDEVTLNFDGEFLHAGEARADAES